MKGGVEQDGAGGSVEVTFKDKVAILTMKRGQNRINEQMVEQMHSALDQVERNPDAIALVTTGVGKFYSNGLDAAWMAHVAKTDPEKFVRIRTHLSRSITFRLLTFPLPTIALLNGHTFAAGAILSLCHDHVIMQNSRGWWCLNEVHINLAFHPTIVELFKCKIPKRGSFQDATVLGRRFTADEAKEAGIVQESCAPDDMYSRALAWVRKVVPPSGYNREHLKTMKEDVYQKVFDLASEPVKEFQPKL